MCPLLRRVLLYRAGSSGGGSSPNQAKPAAKSAHDQHALFSFSDGFRFGPNPHQQLGLDRDRGKKDRIRAAFDIPGVWWNDTEFKKVRSRGKQHTTCH